MPILGFSASSDNKRFNSGFTLVEVVVALSVTLILAGIVLSYGRETSNGLTLANQEAALLGLVNHAKSLSQSFSLKDASAGNTLCSYGVHVDLTNSSVIIFADQVSSDSTCDSTNNSYDSGEELQGAGNAFYVDKSFKFSSSTDLQDVVFVPPDPKVIINNDPVDTSNPGSGTSEAVVGLESKDNSALKFSIRVTHFGQIELE